MTLRPACICPETGLKSLRRRRFSGAMACNFSLLNHRLDTDRRELRRASESVAGRAQVFDLLVYCGEPRPRVSKDDLIASVWGAGSCRIPP